MPFADRETSELRREDHERFVEHPALLQIAEERGRGLIEDARVLAVIGAQVFVTVPVDARFAEMAAVVHLNAADALLDQTPRHQAVVAVVARDGIVEAVHLARRFVLAAISVTSGALTCIRAASS